MTAARNDFAPIGRLGAQWDEDIRRETLEDEARHVPTPPELIAEEEARHSRLIARAVGCPECAAAKGELCCGLARGFHYARGLAFARS